MEVCCAIVNIGEETSSFTIKKISINAVRHCTLTRSEDLTNWTPEQCWEQNSHTIRCRHADVVDVWVQWPCAHVADVVTRKLISTTNLIVKVEGTVVGDWIERIISTAKDVNSYQVGTRRKTHVIHLTVERIWAARKSVKMLKLLLTTRLTRHQRMCTRNCLHLDQLRDYKDQGSPNIAAHLHDSKDSGRDRKPPTELCPIRYF